MMKFPSTKSNFIHSTLAKDDEKCLSPFSLVVVTLSQSLLIFRMEQLFTLKGDTHDSIQMDFPLLSLPQDVSIPYVIVLVDQI